MWYSYNLGYINIEQIATITALIAQMKGDIFFNSVEKTRYQQKIHKKQLHSPKCYKTDYTTFLSDRIFQF